MGNIWRSNNYRDRRDPHVCTIPPQRSRLTAAARLWTAKAKSRDAVETHGRPIDEIERNVNNQHIHYDLRRIDGYLIEAEDSDDDLEEELAAAHRCGLSDVEWADRAPITGYDTGRCL